MKMVDLLGENQILLNKTLAIVVFSNITLSLLFGKKICLPLSQQALYIFDNFMRLNEFFLRKAHSCPLHVLIIE